MKRSFPALLILTLLTGCRDAQSVLAPRGDEAERVALLSWVLFGGGAVILALVVGLAALALFGRGDWRGWLSGEWAIVWGGLVLPVVVLSGLLVYGLAVTRAGAVSSANAQDNLVRIRVDGELWWWRMTYTDAQDRSFETANELRLPVGRRVAIELATSNVIHSFWVPNLAGKLDMIPGRTNVLHLTARQPGVSRGQCAEYCGGAHALMALDVIAMPEDEFEAWMRAQAAPAETPPDTSPAGQGARLFLAFGCAACHTVRGASSVGRIGPDLTHVASRRTIAAGSLVNSPASLSTWIVRSHEIKPENLMPPYEVLDGPQLDRLTAYLSALR